MSDETIGARGKRISIVKIGLPITLIVIVAAAVAAIATRSDGPRVRVEAESPASDSSILVGPDLVPANRATLSNKSSEPLSGSIDARLPTIGAHPDYVRVDCSDVPDRFAISLLGSKEPSARVNCFVDHGSEPADGKSYDILTVVSPEALEIGSLSLRKAWERGVTTIIYSGVGAPLPETSKLPFTPFDNPDVGRTTLHVGDAPGILFRPRPDRTVIEWLDRAHGAFVQVASSASAQDAVAWLDRVIRADQQAP